MDLGFILITMVAIIIVAGIAYLVYYLYKRAKNSTADVKAKGARALKIAKRFAFSRSFTIISPASLAKDGRFADLDFIMVGYFGVLGVKCLGLGGEIYGNSGDAMWLQVASNKRISFENPIITAQSDGRVIRDTLFAAGLKSIPVEVVVVCTNKKATLAIPRSTGHFTLKDFKRYLGKEKFEQDKGIDIPTTVQAIKKWLA